MSIRCTLWPLVLVAFLLITGCTKKTMVVLMPDPDGKVGRIAVTTEAGKVEMTRPHQSTVVAGSNSPPAPPRQLTEEEIARDFHEALQSLPEPPEHFVLYFQHGSEELTTDSQDKLPEVLASIARRDSQDISVVGHTDTAGDKNYNLRLSQRRAAAVTEVLIDKGVTKNHIRSTSHGEQNPLVPTADNVSEPRNRRVEVVVR